MGGPDNHVGILRDRRTGRVSDLRGLATELEYMLAVGD